MSAEIRQPVFYVSLPQFNSEANLLKVVREQDKSNY